MSRRGPRNPRLEGLAALLLAAAFLALGLSSSARESLTWDEPTYIGSGYAYLTRGDFRFNESNPPLLQDLIALPLVLQGLRVPPGDYEHWEAQGPNPKVEFGRQLVFHSGNDPLRIAFWARLSTLLLGAALVLVAYRFGRELYGGGPALVGTALVALCPNLLAHGRLATLDLGCSAFLFAAVWTFWRMVRRPGRGATVVCGLATGLALSTKHTALLLGPIYGILFVGLWLRGHPAARSPRTVASAAAVVVAVAALVVGACYNFTFDYAAYLHGVGRIYSDIRPDYLWYFMGEFSAEPRWYYALAVLAMKTPVPTLLLLVLAGAFAARDRERREATLFLLVPALVVLAASCFDAANLGIRRILPALPFLLLFASQTLAGGRSRPMAAGVLALVACSAVQTLRIHPHYLSFFSTAVGGPRAGPELLDDSNVDWGQDLPALAEWQRAHPQARPLRLAYFGTAEPSAYGVDSVPVGRAEVDEPLRGYYAVSAHMLVHFRRLGVRAGKDLDWLSRYEPIGRAGWSIYLFHFE